MIAKVNFSPNISRSLAYGGNELKGGEIFLQSGYITCLSPEENAARWERMSNDYRNKAVHVILSFSDKDTKTLRGMTREVRITTEQGMLREFMDVLTEKGNNVKDCPFVCFNHDNTDNDHLHLYVLMTTWEGKRLATDFIGKNADRAAARVSILWNMEGPLRAVKSEWKHMLKTGAITEDRMSDQLREYYDRPKEKRHHEWSADQDVINERLRRKEAVEAAAKRKKKYAFIVSETAKECKGTTEFIAKLRSKGVDFINDPKKGHSVSFFDTDKRYTYSFRQLGLDPKIVPYYTYSPEVSNGETAAKVGRVGNETRESKSKEAQPVRRHDQAHSVKSAPNDVRSSGNATRPAMPRDAGGGSSSENREWEISEKEDYEDSIRNSSRMKM